ncbi:MAG: hypothetical protein EXS10_09770 [Phycisphaerales bacterium]|nr:hypothetical protein [Phycisphaerales bacterium]
MSNLTESSGYSHEDARFHELDAKALASMRTQLDAKRAAAAAVAAKVAHWLRCPKCGGEMQEQSFENVSIDQCTSCKGVYFDSGELELLLSHSKARAGLMGRLFSR